MNSISKKTKAILLALLAALVCIAMALGLAACGNDDNGENNAPEDKDPVTTKYSATLDASITMIPTQPAVSFGSILDGAYVTDDNGSYTLTLIFTVGEVSVMTAKGNIFVDDNPAEPATVNGITEGTLGAYNSDGELITEGVKVTYSTAGAFEANKEQKNVYYVKSAALPVDSLKNSYDVSFYCNSTMMGKQFSKDSYPATVNLDLDSGEVVEEISGLGVATRGNAPQFVKTMTFTVSEVAESYNLSLYISAYNETMISGMQFPYKTFNAVLSINKEEGEGEGEDITYTASLHATVVMGQAGSVDFAENLLDGIEVKEVDDGGYEITLSFCMGDITMPVGTMTGCVNSAPSIDHNSGTEVNPVFGYFDGETLVTEGVILS